jgi:hypothetical protein
LTTRIKLACRVYECKQPVPTPLGSELLCVDHFLEQALCNLESVAIHCRNCQTIDPGALDQLSMQAESAIHFLACGSLEKSHLQKERMLNFLLGLANLHQYLSHHVSLVGRPN